MNKHQFLIIISLLFLFLSAVTIASDLIIESKVQSYSDSDKLIKFLGDVKVTYEDITIVGDKADVSTTKDNRLDTATFYEQPYAFQINNNKKREVKANILKLSLLNKTIRAEGDAQMVVTEGRTPIAIINADSQEYDTQSHTMTALGKVTIKYRDINAYGDKAVLRVNENGDVERMDLIGHAKIDETKHHGVADHFIYNAKSEEMVAMGNTISTTITDDGSEFKITGKYQQYDKKKNVYMASGNVQVYYQDYYSKSPKITCFPDKDTKKINEVFMTGRSMIRQNDKEIYADKIKMIINPKDFVAIGHVKTIIKNLSEQKSGKDGGFL